MSATTRFDEALDAVEHLTLEEQADLLEVVRLRLAEKGRRRVIEEVQEGEAEFERGEGKASSVDELMREMQSC